jgi:hypothetical protein
MDPNTQDTPQWPPPNPNQAPTFVPMPEGGQPLVQRPQPPQQQQFQQQTPLPAQPTSQPPVAKKPRPSSPSTWLVLTGICAAIVLVIGTATALFWPKKQAVVQQPKTSTVSSYYYADTYTSDASKKDASTLTLAVANPITGGIQKHALATAWPFITGHAIQFTSDGSRYVYATSDGSGDADPAASTPENYQLITGTWPQQKDKERVLYTETKPNDVREWLLTHDGKELIYLDITTDAHKNVTTSDLYSIDIATGKSTKIGAVDRPLDRENTPLYESTKDGSVSFYTSQNDGIYTTHYNRKTRTLTNKKAVIRDYDPGRMGVPSPDGTKMLYFGNSKDDFTVYLLDLTEGGSTPLTSTPAKYGGYSGGYWSPDGKQAVLSAAIKDVDGKHYENQMILVDTVVRTTANDMISRNKSPDTDNTASTYTITSWSPDGNYITYVQNSQLYFYDLKDGKVVDSVEVGHSVDASSTILGWIVTTKQTP